VRSEALGAEIAEGADALAEGVVGALIDRWGRGEVAGGLGDVPGEGGGAAARARRGELVPAVAEEVLQEIEAVVEAHEAALTLLGERVGGGDEEIRGALVEEGGGELGELGPVDGDRAKGALGLDGGAEAVVALVVGDRWGAGGGAEGGDRGDRGAG
jgi:hypothetical protein